MAWSDYITTPTSYRANLERLAAGTATYKLANKVRMPQENLDLGHVTILVLEAVLEVVCVSLPGYVVARQGTFDADAQKFVANLNVLLFTPCMVFTKLASQLTADKLQDLAIIPVIYFLQTASAFLGASLLSWLLRMNKRQKNFITAMGVFGNSNSLPMSLIVTLASTLDNLHWAQMPGDNDEEVAARGILYLIVFQQFGQLLRWTWGYNVLLAPADRYSEKDGGTAQIGYVERGRTGNKDEHDGYEDGRLLSPAFSDDYPSDFGDGATEVNNSPTSRRAKSPASLRASSRDRLLQHPDSRSTHVNHDADTRGSDVGQPSVSGIRSYVDPIKRRSVRVWKRIPRSVRKPLAATLGFLRRFFAGLWEFMNPPLMAMLIAIVVASIPKLQHLFFDKGTFVSNSVTKALNTNGAVAIPLILVVLGGNLARNAGAEASRPGEQLEPGTERKMLIACLVSRMIIPTLITAPILAYMAKHLPINILDDKIFIIVCFLISGAPPALQLAQICNINDVYMSVVGKILLQAYVIWLLPSTLLIVILSLVTVRYAES